jgi:hypothetical protein
MDFASQLASKPWNLAPVPDPVSPASRMMGAEERRALWWLGREALGEGAIVDVGAFLGAGTFCLAEGASSSPRARNRPGPIIHAFDSFTADEDYLVEALCRDARPAVAGDSYLDLFLERIAPHGPLVKPVQGPLRHATWNEGPIDLLCLGMTNDAQTHAHLAGTMFPSLVPGRSVVVQRDYYHCWHPSIHITMEYLADEFRLVDDRIEFQSAAWLLQRSIPAEKLLRVAHRKFEPDEELSLLDRVVSKASDRIRPMMEVTRAWHMHLRGAHVDALVALRSLRYRHGRPTGAELWRRQSRQVERHVTGALGVAPEKMPWPEAESSWPERTVHDFTVAAMKVHTERGCWGDRHAIPSSRRGRWPDFLVIGAQKAGTTWLYRNLQFHPEVWLPPIKELNYLNQRFAPQPDDWYGAKRLRDAEQIRHAWPPAAEPTDAELRRARALEACAVRHLDETGYRTIFGCAHPDQVCGEFTPDYCLLPREAIRHVARRQPALRALLILRDPVDRALSQLAMDFADGRIPDPSCGVCDHDMDSAIARSHYRPMIDRWQSMLPPGALHLLCYEDIRDEPLAFLDRVCRIIGVMPDERLFPACGTAVFRGRPTVVHADAISRLQSRLSHVYGEIRDVAPDIAKRWDASRNRRP